MNSYILEDQQVVPSRKEKKIKHRGNNSDRRSLTNESNNLNNQVRTSSQNGKDEKPAPIYELKNKFLETIPSNAQVAFKMTLVFSFYSIQV